jgi:hypothetical protein
VSRQLPRADDPDLLKSVLRDPLIGSALNWTIDCTAHFPSADMF